MDEEKLEFLLATEQKRYEAVDKSFSEMRNRRLALLSVEFALFAYLFADLRNLIPTELYGIIFFAIGVTLIIVSIGLSLYHCRPVIWPDPIGPLEKERINNSKTKAEWLEVATNDYAAAAEEGKRIISKHSKTFNFSLIFFILGLIILLIIKFF